MNTNKKECVHTHKVWKGEIQFCFECATQTDFNDMTLKVIYPNGKTYEKNV